MTFTVLDRMMALSVRYPDRLAVVSGDRQLSFSQLLTTAGKTAAVFQSTGMQQGDLVGITARDGVGHLIELLACWCVGSVPVPLDFRMSATEVDRISIDFGLSYVLSDRHSEMSHATILVRDDHWKRKVDGAEIFVPMTPPEKSDAVVSLTSGTTGRPVGIVLNQMENYLRVSQYHRLTGGTERFAHAGFMSFSAIRNHVIGHLLAGSTVHFFPPLISPGEFAERLLANDITNTFVVPPMVRGLLAEYGEQSSPVFHQMKCMWSGGSDLTIEEKIGSHRSLTNGFLHCFSSSVTGTCSILTGSDLLNHPQTDGRIIDSVRIEIVDENDGVLPLGEVGQMRVRSSAMSTRILGVPRDSGDRLKEGWAYTGDLASVDADGFLTIHGRTGDMIIRGGANVYPAEVEHVLSRMPGLIECAVVGVDAKREGQEIVAFVVLKDGASADDVLAFAERELVSDKRPRRVVALQSLPRNANGKVLRRTLSEEAEN